MKIISLKAENIKRLKAVEITPDPDGNLVIVSGRNNQGKTSVLDSIMYALAGTRAIPDMPIREGESGAEVSLDLGDFTVTRNWTSNEKSYLKVVSGDGAVYTSPQKMLDDLVGRLSFDPLEFSRKDAKAQRATLIELADIDIDLDANAASRGKAFTERRDIGRDMKAAEARLGVMTAPSADIPIDEISISEVAGRLSAANESNANRDRMVADGIRIAEKVKSVKAELAGAEAKLSEARAAVAGVNQIARSAMKT